GRDHFSVVRVVIAVFAAAGLSLGSANAAEGKRADNASKVAGSGASRSLLKNASPTPAAPRFSGVIFNQMGSNFRDAEAPDHKSSMSSTAMLSYRLSTDWQAISVLGFSQQMTGEQKFRMRNTELRVMYRSAILAEGISLLNGLNTVFPTNLDSRQLESLYMGVGLANRLKFDLAAHGVPGLSGFYDLNLNRKFHEFDTSVSGEWNTEYMLEHFLLTSYAFTKYVGVMIAADFTHQWDYAGGVSNSWGFSQELDFYPSQTFQFGIGHTNGGNILGANGRSYNIGLFNPNQSTFYLSVNVAL
ncbi:MAG: hypothetical protein K2X47_10205, partial [Bdellovibrionales bacterium]|nr:hypothetical protein [Bdellovibrionales bacterium]